MTKTLIVGIAMTAAALAALAMRPDLDLAAASLFFVPPARFVGDTPLGEVMRYIAWTAPFVILATPVLAALGAWIGWLPQRVAPGLRALLFLVLSFALGPGLLVDGIFKLIAHRPRPHSVEAFGGPDRFRPFTRFDGACTHSCSFPSAETAGALWTIAPASLMPPPWRAAAIGGAIVFAAATGLLRMAFGGHFLSDVLGAACLTLASVLAVRIFVCRRRRKPDS